MVKNKTLYILGGSVFFLLVISVIYNSFIIDHVEPIRLVYDEEGNAKTSPFTPAEAPPMGTDKGGNNIALRLIEGFQYTFLIVIGVTICRLLVGLAIAYLLVFPFKWFHKWFLWAVMPYQFVPAFIIVIWLTGNIGVLQEKYTMGEIIALQFCLLAFVGIPVVANTLANEMKQVLKNEYISASVTLGASNIRLFSKHLIPVLKSKIIIITLQQISMSLVLLMHLGVLGYYIGGKQEFAVDIDGQRYLSMSGEWAGMIGDSKRDMINAPWIFFGPLGAAVTLLIMINWAIRSLEGQQGRARARK